MNQNLQTQTNQNFQTDQNPESSNQIPNPDNLQGSKISQISSSKISQKTQKIILKIKSKNSIQLNSTQLNSVQNLSNSEKTEPIIPEASQKEISQKAKVVVIGAGFSGLSAACYLARSGFEVVVIEKNLELGGRARVWEAETSKGKFKFDMGPSWYWMPGIFESFFEDFGHTVSDFYKLAKLPTQYRMFVNNLPKENGENIDWDQPEAQKTSEKEKNQNLSQKHELLAENSQKNSSDSQKTPNISSENWENSQRQKILEIEQNETKISDWKIENNSNSSKIQENPNFTELNQKSIENISNQPNSQVTRQDLERKKNQIKEKNNYDQNHNFEDLENKEHWQNFIDMPCEYEDIKVLFEKLETGSGKKLDEFAKHGEFTYGKGVGEYMQKPSLSPFEFASFDFACGVLRAGILESFGNFVRQNFEHPIIRQMLEFPVLFLGATPVKTPKIYTLMAYTCLKHGTFYPDGGMGEIVTGMVKLAQTLGVQFITNTEIIKIETQE